MYKAERQLIKVKQEKPTLKAHVIDIQNQFGGEVQKAAKCRYWYLQQDCLADICNKSGIIIAKSMLMGGLPVNTFYELSQTTLMLIIEYGQQFGNT